MQADVTYYFDLSTSARWSGHAVGIVRAERELARYAYTALPERVQFCVYTRQDNRFRVVRRELVGDILDGKLQLRFDAEPVAAEPPPPDAPPTLRKQVRDWLIERPALYQRIQRARGRSYTIDEIVRIRQAEKIGAASAVGAVSAPVTKRMSVDEASDHDVPLSPSIVIINGGLDWEYKDLRAIQKMKAAHPFHYCAIVHDIIPLLFPHYVVPSYADLLTDYFGELFWLADFAMTNSRTTERDMLEHCAENLIPAPRGAWFPMGSNLPVLGDEVVDFPQDLVGKRYAVFVSTIEPRKNHRAVYQAWEHAIREGRIDPETCRLVFIGHEGWQIGDLLGELRANPVARKTIVQMSSISDALLAELYRRCEFAVFPSFYEGYGLPLVEALSYGKPCISSPRGSLREVGGDLAIYVDPLDVLGWSEAMGRLMGDPVLAASAQAEVAKRYVPELWSTATAEFYRRLDRVVAGLPADHDLGARRPTEAPPVEAAPALRPPPAPPSPSVASLQVAVSEAGR